MKTKDTGSHLNISARSALQASAEKNSILTAPLSAQDKVPDGYGRLVMKIPQLPLGRTYHKKKFITNEVLCYLQNKMDSLPFELIVKIASDFYDDETISQAKIVLFQEVSHPSTRYRQCRGESKSYEDIRDMLKLLLSVQLEDIPIFLALDLSNIPPLAGETQDLSSVLADINAMKTSLKLLTDAHKDLAECVIAVSSKCPNAGEQNTAEKPATAVLPVNQLTTDVDKESDSNELSSEVSVQMRPVPELQVQATTHRIKTNGYKPTYSRVVVNSRGRYEDPQAAYRSTSYGSDKRRERNPIDVSLGSSMHPRDMNKPSNEQVIVGHGSAPGLRSINRPMKSSESHPNRSCTGVFVSRLLPKTSQQMVETYI